MGEPLLAARSPVPAPSNDWTQAIEDVIGLLCSRPNEYDPDPQEIRQALEEVLQTAQETFDRLGHFCSSSACRCRSQTLVSMRAFVEARVLGINSVDAQIFAMDRLNEYLNARS
jgi:hypothetical protein